MPERKGHGQADKAEYYATTPPQALRSCEGLARDVFAYAGNYLCDCCAPLGQPRRILNPNRILEPTAGTGIWMPAMQRVWPRAYVKGIELDPELSLYARNQGLDVDTADILNVRLKDRYDLIAGNPPFSLIEQIIPRLMEDAATDDAVIAMLVRMNLEEGNDRYPWWGKHPLFMRFPLPNRPGFTADGGTDGTGYMMAVWRKGHTSKYCISTHLDNTDVEVRWSQGRREKKDPKTKAVIEPAVLDPRFPDPRKVPQPVIQRALQAQAEPVVPPLEVAEPVKPPVRRFF